MSKALKDITSPIAQTINNKPRSEILKQKANSIVEIYDTNSHKFTGKADEFKDIFKGCIEPNLWELCYFMIQNTSYGIPAPFYKSCLKRAEEAGSFTFMYALMEWAIISGIQVFEEIDSNENKQQEHLEKITTEVYGIPIGAFNQEQRERVFKGI